MEMPLGKAYTGVTSGAGVQLYMSERYSDIEIFVDYGDSLHRFPAHSLFLRTLSDVMRNMLDCNMSEKSSKQITIKDHSTTAIKQFLRFMYTGEVIANDWRDVVELLSVAHKYNVGPLVDICEKLLTQSITLGTSCFLHDVAQLYGLPELLSLTRKLVLDGGFVILASGGFEEMTAKSVEYFISNAYFNVESELSILNAVRKWATAECSRRTLPMTKGNILTIMEPFLCKIRLSKIAEGQMTFIPCDILNKYNEIENTSRIKYFVPPSLHNHMASLKFVVELGCFANRLSVVEPLSCLKFSCDVNLFILGFRIVAMFRNSFTFGSGNPMLVLCKESDRNQTVKFDLSSVPWKGGSPVGEQIWREVVAYFPSPARVDPFTTYSLSIKYGNLLPAKWPKTKIETNNLNTEMGQITIYTFGQCCGVTEVLLLPAPMKLEQCGDML